MKYRIYTPVKDYNGTSASVSFRDGVGETDKDNLAEWFEEHGYKVEKAEAVGEEEAPQGELEGKTIEELKAYASEHGIDIGNTSTEKGIMKKIAEFKAAEEQ